MSEETKRKISEGVKSSTKYKENFSKSLLNRVWVGKPMTEEQKLKMNRKGVSLSEEQKRKISESIKNSQKFQENNYKAHAGKPAWNKGITLEKVECPYCKKSMNKGNAKRWHFDNCSHKDSSVLEEVKSSDIISSVN